MATTQIFIDRLMDKENMLYTYNGILFSLKTEDSTTCDNIDGPEGHYNH